MANFNVVVDGIQYSDTDIRIMRERIAELEADNDTLQVLYKGALKDLEVQATEIEWQKAAKNSLASRLTDCQAENERLRKIGGKK